MSTKSVDILAINETRLDCTISNGEINIPGYVIERKDRNIQIFLCIADSHAPLKKKRVRWISVS